MDDIRRARKATESKGIAKRRREKEGGKKERTLLPEEQRKERKTGGRRRRKISTIFCFSLSHSLLLFTLFPSLQRRFLPYIKRERGERQTDALPFAVSQRETFFSLQMMKEKKKRQAPPFTLHFSQDSHINLSSTQTKSSRSLRLHVYLSLIYLKLSTCLCSIYLSIYL